MDEGIDKLPLIVVNDESAQIRIEPEDMVHLKTTGGVNSIEGHSVIWVYHDGMRGSEEGFLGKAVCLSTDYKWTLGTDGRGFQILIPTEK